ncbi:MAG: PfkB family carbohydrate kinase [Phormidesmis sp.]
MTKKHGLFIGLTTLDCIYQADHPPATNEKVVADKSLLVAGGPATNAAVAFSQLGGSEGNQATLVSVLGEHPLTTLLREDVQGQGVALVDLAPNRLEPPPVSSIVVTAGTGNRAVVARNAENMQMAATQVSAALLEGVDVVLIDGHQMAVGAQVAHWAKAKSIPVVVDAGSWKPNFETVLALADAVVASANFFPPDCHSADQVFAYLKTLGVAQAAITQGAEPILYAEGGDRAEVEVPQVRAVDTLGAGDIFHGAFCHFYTTHTFTEALLKASRSASFACQYWGTRAWTKIYRMADEDEDPAS